MTSAILADPDVGADSAGNACAVWQDSRNSRNEIWFSTNTPVGVTEAGPTPTPQRITCTPSHFTGNVTIRVRHSLLPGQHAEVCDATGRVVRLIATTEGVDVLSWNGRDSHERRCAPGAYIVRAGGASTKVILLPAD
jgi:hypothetical protein